LSLPSKASAKAQATLETRRSLRNQASFYAVFLHLNVLECLSLFIAFNFHAFLIFAFHIFQKISSTARPAQKDIPAPDESVISP
jgi:hypothetical protein